MVLALNFSRILPWMFRFPNKTASVGKAVQLTHAYITFCEIQMTILQTPTRNRNAENRREWTLNDDCWEYQISHVVSPTDCPHEFFRLKKILLEQHWTRCKYTRTLIDCWSFFFFSNFPLIFFDMRNSHREFQTTQIYPGFSHKYLHLPSILVLI